MSDPTPSNVTIGPNRVFAWQRNKTLFISLIGGGLALLIVATLIMWRSLNGPPFEMTVEQDDDHALVQFKQPKARLSSKAFPIEFDDRFERRQVIVLDSPIVTIPAGRIEFADTTLMPGRFTIRLGQSVFDVMPSGIDVDGKHFSWRDPDSLR